MGPCRAASSGQDELRELARLVEGDQLLVAARIAGIIRLRPGGTSSCPVRRTELRATLRVLGEVDLLERDAALVQEGLGDAAVAAGLSRVDGDLAHGFRKYSAITGSGKNRRNVLRSLHYGEADRILHLYTPERGRVSVIAKRRAQARSPVPVVASEGKPYFRLDLVLYLSGPERL